MITATHTPKDYGQSFYKFKRQFVLSDKEKIFLAEIMKVKSDSVWGMVIHAVITDFTIEKFRQLVCELLSQQHDDYLTLENVIGTEASKALLKLRP